MNNKRAKMSTRSLAIICILLALVLLLSLLLVWQLAGRRSAAPAASQPPASSAASVPASIPASLPGGDISASDNSDTGTPVYEQANLPGEMRAMWITFLEWNQYDISTEAALRATLALMFDNCAATGLNTVIVQVRPFGDALYKSSIYPWSHLITGTQGQDPGYDPLAVMIEEAHTRGLRLEAYINPYRIVHKGYAPAAYAATNPAVLHPDWVRNAGTVDVYDPGIPEVGQMVVDGVVEIVQNYDIDGIHFDDYFYPEGIDESFDAETFAQYGAGQQLDVWRRANTSRLVQNVYAAIKAVKPSLPFGISPAGNNDNNYAKSYIDTKLWLANPGYVDYLMPQIYWGFTWVSGDNDFAAFDNMCAMWGGYPRANSVKLYAGLAIYRIGEPQPDGSRTGLGHGGSGEQTEWESGHNMADQVLYLRQTGQFDGFGLFRYAYLYAEADPLAQQEQQALHDVLL